MAQKGERTVIRILQVVNDIHRAGLETMQISINFNTQFVEVLPNTGTSSRNQSILELTGLTNRIVRDLNDFSYIDQEIDFKEANEKIGISRIESIRILEEMLTEQIGI